MNEFSTIQTIYGKIHVVGIIRSPHTMIHIKWEVDGSSGTTECEAWRGQYEIDCLIESGYSIKGFSIS